ncbi:MAG TPA: hypothetical protein VF585_10750 [Chthoniobacterales bacterium]|jgi:uncharacterized membrane protein
MSIQTSPSNSAGLGAGGAKSREAQQTALLYYFALAGLTVVGYWLRLAWIDHPMRYDEAYSATMYVLPGKWFAYNAPNNHILNTLLMHLCVMVSGFSAAALRFPAFISGILIIPATAWCAHVLSGRKLAGLLAAGFIATSSIFIEYSTNARGYSLVCLSSLVMVTLSLLIAQNPSARWQWIAWGVAAVVGLYAVPTMLSAVVLASLLMVIVGGRSKMRQLLPRLAVTLFAAGVTTLAIYVPVLRANGLNALIGNRWVTPEPIHLLPRNLWGLAVDLLEMIGTDCSLLSRGLLCLGLTGVVIAGVQRRSKLWVLPALSLAVMCLFPLLQRRVPPARVDLFLLPFFLAAAAGGLLYWCDFFRDTVRRKAAFIAMACACLAGWAGNAWAGQHRDFLIIKEPWECVDAVAVVDFLFKNGLFYSPNRVYPSHSTSATCIYYYTLDSRAERKPMLSLTDEACEHVYLLIWKEDPIDEFYRKVPELQTRFDSPQLVRTFPSTAVYVCHRRK